MCRAARAYITSYTGWRGSLMARIAAFNHNDWCRTACMAGFLQQGLVVQGTVPGMAGLLVLVWQHSLAFRCTRQAGSPAYKGRYYSNG